MAHVLGVDSSTQSTKVELRDAETGALIASGRGAHPATSPPRSEQDPEAWWQALLEALGELNEDLSSVAAVSVGGQQHGLVLVGEDGDALRPAKLWNDTESAPQAAALTEVLGAQVWADTTGLVPVASFTLTKLAWVAEHEPELIDKIAHIMLPHDYLTWRLSGRRVTDRGDASGTAWWSPITGEYVPDMLSAAGLSTDLVSLMPEVLAPLEAAGTVVAAETGISPSAIVAPGSGDNMAGALGIGLGSGDVAVSLGTSGTAYAVSETPTKDASGSVAGFADASGRYLPLVATLNATKVTDWMGSMLGLDPAGLSEAALQSEAGSHGAVVVPYFDGERTPNRPNATGSIDGLRTGTSRNDLARACFEGVACGLLDGVDAVANAGVKLDGRLLLLGGGARSRAFQQVFAELANRPVVVPEADEAVATGACVQAAAVLAQRDPLEVSQAWEVGAGLNVELPNGPDDSVVDHAAIRARYHEAIGED